MKFAIANDVPAGSNIAIPGSSNEKHIIEDASVWDFSLTDDEMKQMAAINKDRRNADY